MSNKSIAEKPNSKFVELFDAKKQSSPSVLASINKIDKYASVRSANGKQLAHIDISKDDSAKEKLEKLYSQLEKLCIRDVNYWVKLPTGGQVRKNAILGFECSNGKHRGVILRTINNRVLSFIPCLDEETQIRIIQELKLAIEHKTPSRRYQPTWDFYQEQAA